MKRANGGLSSRRFMAENYDCRVLAKASGISTAPDCMCVEGREGKVPCFLCGRNKAVLVANLWQSRVWRMFRQK